MKMYEKMGIDPTTEQGIEQILNTRCHDIPDRIAKGVPTPLSLGCLAYVNDCQ